MKNAEDIMAITLAALLVHKGILTKEEIDETGRMIIDRVCLEDKLKQRGEYNGRTT